MRKKIVAGNWKMNMTLENGESLVTSLLQELKDVKKCDVVFCPPFPLLPNIYELIRGTRFGLGGQNLYWEDEGAYTGEVSASMLLSVGCNYVIIGHSERRKYFSERDDYINRKVKKALQVGLIPIMCIGETLEEREDDRTKNVIETQLEGGLKDISSDNVRKMIIAYEPVWAIGTGKNATPAQAVDVHKYIRELLESWYDTDVANTVRIQYGGSVNDKNADDLLSQPDIDGALVGGASLKAEKFSGIVHVGELRS